MVKRIFAQDADLTFDSFASEALRSRLLSREGARSDFVSVAEEDMEAVEEDADDLLSATDTPTLFDERGIEPVSSSEADAEADSNDESA